MKVNWKVRMKNKTFWVAIVPAGLLLVQTAAVFFGFQMDLSQTEDKILNVINALFAVLTLLGVVMDPTTTGLGDSTQALTYDAPKEEL